MTTDTPQPRVTYRKDYRPYPFAIDSVQLDFQLEPSRTRVGSRLEVRRTGDAAAPLVLDGEDLTLKSVFLDDVELGEERYELDAAHLTLRDVPDRFTLRVAVVIDPAANTQLSGLYVSGGMFCTQCEAEGFRRITFFPDRPDVMTRFQVMVEADVERCPVLLSNGNLIFQDASGEGRHTAVWEDPWPKPSYLFALVAGDLGHVHGTFTTMGGREVQLNVYSEHDNVDRLDHALACLKKAMRWDEERFGREYDLDRYNIVAVDDFNMGAMENKSLNVFNSARVLASPATATDADFEGIDGVVAHEYFHNWTGNRVTLRDWFQLTLKEGLTVLRDQLYSADQVGEAVKRIDDVRILRAMQFPEDAGPLAHPVRPDSYIAMDNFYTVTVYNKGAEVIRMMRTLLGPEGFRRGMDLYFERHDGQAVTCDDFRAAMADANDVELDQFERWYDQAGTPEVEVEGAYDAGARTYTLTMRQSCPPTPGQPDKQPFHIPIATGLIGPTGADLIGTRVLELREPEQAFVFEDLDAEPVPSLLRGFSAPVRLRVIGRTDQQLAHLLAHDPDPFHRWEAGQVLARKVILPMVEAVGQGERPELPTHLVEAVRATLLADELDPSLQAAALRLPDEATLGSELAVDRPVALHEARWHVLQTLARQLGPELQAAYARHTVGGPYRYDPSDAGHRRMRNLALGFLATLRDEAAIARCTAQFESADNMTDQIAALACLASIPGGACDGALAAFYEQWKRVPLVIDKWFAVQAFADRDDTLERVTALWEHPAMDPRNPNKVRAVLATFCHNRAAFHRADGAGYAWAADRLLELDALNPQVSARTAGVFTTWRRFGQERQAQMRAQLERIAGHEGLSPDLYEIVHRSLEG